MPPVEVVYQLILLLTEVAFKLVEAPLQSEVGEAEIPVGVDGNAGTVMLLVTALAQPLLLVTV